MRVVGFDVPKKAASSGALPQATQEPESRSLLSPWSSSSNSLGETESGKTGKTDFPSLNEHQIPPPRNVGGGSSPTLGFGSSSRLPPPPPLSNSNPNTTRRSSSAIEISTPSVGSGELPPPATPMIGSMSRSMNMSSLMQSGNDDLASFSLAGNDIPPVIENHDTHGVPFGRRARASTMAGDGFDDLPPLSSSFQPSSVQLRMNGASDNIGLTAGSVREAEGLPLPFSPSNNGSLGVGRVGGSRAVSFLGSLGTRARSRTNSAPLHPRSVGANFAQGRTILGSSPNPPLVAPPSSLANTSPVALGSLGLGAGFGGSRIPFSPETSPRAGIGAAPLSTVHLRPPRNSPGPTRTGSGANSPTQDTAFSPVASRTPLNTRRPSISSPLAGPVAMAPHPTLPRGAMGAPASSYAPGTSIVPSSMLGSFAECVEFAQRPPTGPSVGNSSFGELSPSGGSVGVSEHEDDEDVTMDGGGSVPVAQVRTLGGRDAGSFLLQDGISTSSPVRGVAASDSPFSQGYGIHGYTLALEVEGARSPTAGVGAPQTDFSFTSGSFMGGNDIPISAISSPGGALSPASPAAAAVSGASTASRDIKFAAVYNPSLGFDAPYTGYAALSENPGAVDAAPAPIPVPGTGRIHATIYNPNGIAVHSYSVGYDVSSMPVGTKTWIRHRSKLKSSGRLMDVLHVRFARPTSENKFFLFRSVDVIFWAAGAKLEQEAFERRRDVPVEPRFAPLGRADWCDLLSAAAEFERGDVAGSTALPPLME